MIRRHTLIGLILVVAAVAAPLPPAQSSPKGKHVLIHVVSNIKKDDGPPCVAFDIAYANLIAGHRVEMFFDAEAAWNLKRESDRKNDLDRYDVPADLKQLLFTDFKNDEIQKLKNFGEFLTLLSTKGAIISVNGTWNVLTSVEKEIKGTSKMPSFVEPLTLREMVVHLNAAERYYRY